LMVFLKAYLDKQGCTHIKSILDFTGADLAQELTDFQCISFMKLWSDRYDDKGYPLLEKISLEQREKKVVNPNIKLVEKIDRFVKEVYAKGL